MRRHNDVPMVLDRMPSALFIVDGKVYVNTNGGSILVFESPYVDVNALLHPNPDSGYMSGAIITHGRVGNMEEMGASFDDSVSSAGTAFASTLNAMEKVVREIRQMDDAFEYERVGDVALIPVASLPVNDSRREIYDAAKAGQE